MSQYTVHYERKFSDRNFGSEGLSMSWTWESADESESDAKELSVTAGFLRELVLKQLAENSGSDAVRWAAAHELDVDHRRETGGLSDVKENE